MSEVRACRREMSPAVNGITLFTSPVDVGAKVVIPIFDVIVDDDLRVLVLIQIQQLDPTG